MRHAGAGAIKQSHDVKVAGGWSKTKKTSLRKTVKIRFRVAQSTEI